MGLPVPQRPHAAPITHTGHHVVPGSNNIPILTVKVIDYAGKPPDEAAADVWLDWTRRYPGALIQVVHGDAWETLL